MEPRINVLTYAVRMPVVLKYLGQLALILAVLTLAPMAVALAEEEWQRAWRYLFIVLGLLAAAGLSSRLPDAGHLQTNEALTITALAFLISPLIMAWPMMLGGLTYADALFEAASAVTTTGLSVLGSSESASNAFLFSRSWMQWYGGLGIVILSVALLIGHHSAARRLITPGDSGKPLVVTVRTHARLSLGVYVTITILGFLLVWSLQGDGFTALVHVLSAVSTGGFSNFDDSLANLNRAAAIAITSVALLGAISLPLYWRIIDCGWARGWRLIYRDIELRALLAACLILGLVLGGLAFLQGASAPWYHGFMMAFSAQTTTGFSTIAVSEMGAGAKATMIFAMLTGGTVGSTAGGFKLFRLIILLRLLQLTLQRTAMPSHAVSDLYLRNQKVDSDDLLRALQLILLFFVTVGLSWLPFVYMGYDPLDALFEVVSACGTVGLSSGIARPELEPILKAVLCFNMLAGRLEIIALLIILYPRNWLGRREDIQ